MSTNTDEFEGITPARMNPAQWGCLITCKVKPAACSQCAHTGLFSIFLFPSRKLHTVRKVGLCNQTLKQSN